jgi:hypothetical protein
MGGGKNFLVSAAGLSILGNGIFWWKAKTKRLFSQCTSSNSQWAYRYLQVAAGGFMSKNY